MWRSRANGIVINSSNLAILALSSFNGPGVDVLVLNSSLGRVKVRHYFDLILVVELEVAFVLSRHRGVFLLRAQLVGMEGQRGLQHLPKLSHGMSDSAPIRANHSATIAIQARATLKTGRGLLSFEYHDRVDFKMSTNNVDMYRR